MGLLLSARGRVEKSHGIRRRTNTLLVLVFSFELLTVRENTDKHQRYSLKRTTRRLWGNILERIASDYLHDWDINFRCCIYVINPAACFSPFPFPHTCPLFLSLCISWHLEGNRWRLRPGRSSQRQQRRWDFLQHQGPGEGYNEWPAAPCLPWHGPRRRAGDPVSSEPPSMALLSSSYYETFPVSRSITLLWPLLPRVSFSHRWAKVAWAALSSRYAITTPDSNYLTQTMLMRVSGLDASGCAKVIISYFCLDISQ